MVGISIKKIRLYYYIRRYNSHSDKYINTHYHVDDLSIRRVPRRYWYKLVFEAYRLSITYIARKQYNIYCYIRLRVKIKDIENVMELKDIKYTYEPFCIYLWKENPCAVFIDNLCFSEKLSEFFGMKVYICPDEDEKNIWYLYLI